MSNHPPLETNLVSEHHFVPKIMCACDGKALISLSGCEMMDSERHSAYGPGSKWAEAAASVLSTVTSREPNMQQHGWVITHLSARHTWGDGILALHAGQFFFPSDLQCPHLNPGITYDFCDC